jgi:hypothetical protein
MGTQKYALSAEASGFACYRITAGGRAIAARHDLQLRSRYLSDLLDLIDTAGGGIAEAQLRQFMPPASLGESIGALLELGLIERSAGRAVP